jgi:hypothetical protein
MRGLQVAKAGQQLRSLFQAAMAWQRHQIETEQQLLTFAGCPQFVDGVASWADPDAAALWCQAVRRLHQQALAARQVAICNGGFLSVTSAVVCMLTCSTWRRCAGCTLGRGTAHTWSHTHVGNLRGLTRG